jgi:hypothetical protein
VLRVVTGTHLGKAACTFKEVDLARALKAAKKVGVDVQVEIDLERRRMTITPVKRGRENSGPGEGTTAGEGEWDNIL